MGSAATHTIILIITTIFSKLLGFARELSISYAFGATAVSDAYIVAFSIPYIVFAGIGTAILTSYIPISTRLEQTAPALQKKFHNSVMTLVLLLSAVIVGVFILLDKPIVRLFAVGFDDSTLELTVSMSRVMILSIIFIGAYNILQAYLQMRGRFFAVGMVSVPLNICVIVTVLLAGKLGYEWLSWGVVAGYAGSFIMLYIAAKRERFTYRPSVDFRTEGIKRLAIMVMPIFLSKTIQQINVLLDRTLASTLEAGSVSAVSYGNRVIGFVTSVFVVSIATAIFPQLSRFSASSNTKKLKEMLVSSVGIMSFIVLPLSVGMAIFSKEIVSILFLRGAFTEYDVARTASVVTFYALGLLFFSIKDVLLNAFYAIEDSKTPTVNSAIALVVNLVLNLILMKAMGISGLALATSISGFITMAMMIYSLRRKLGNLGLKALTIRMLKMLACTAVMAVAVLPVYDMLWLRTGSMIASLLVAVICGALVYFLLATLLRIKEMGLIVVAVYDRLKKLTGRGRKGGSGGGEEATDDATELAEQPDGERQDGAARKEKPVRRKKQDEFDFDDEDL